MLRCPCQLGCPDGCPCPEYSCQNSTTSSPGTVTVTTMSTSTAVIGTQVLILNTFNPANVPIITNSSGLEDRLFRFELENTTQIYRSCSITWQNRHYVFGGSMHRTQISQIVGCQLKKIGDLSFDHNNGRCANDQDEKLYLCFNSNTNDYQKCRIGTSPTGQFVEITSSYAEHYLGGLAAGQSK